jgi:hypothetical protein
MSSDGCVSPACQQQFGASSSLSQGQSFANMTKDFHGGKNNSRSRRRMRGGAADFPSSFDALLPSGMHGEANLGSLDKAFAQLPQFAGKYGMSGGRYGTRKMRGGVADVSAPAMILSAGEERAAFLNPQWYTENQVVPSFKGPESAYAQKAGKRKGRKSRKANRKNRKTSRKSRKSRKANRKGRKANRK